MNSQVYFFVLLAAIGPIASESSQLMNTNVWQTLFYKFPGHTAAKRETTNSTRKPLCDENKLMIRIAKLQIVSPDSLITMVTSQNVFDFCRKCESTGTANQKEESKCQPLPRDNLYVKLLQGSKEFCSPILNKSEVKKEYLKHESCFQELAEEFMDCQGPDDWYEATNLTLACKINKEILDCLMVKTVRLCGPKAAHLLYSLSQKPFEVVLQHNCKVPEINSGLSMSTGQTSKYILTTGLGLSVIRFIWKI